MHLNAPQEESVGIVVESPRMSGMREGFEWYCFDCKTRVHRTEVALADASGIVTALPGIYDAFHADMEARTCPSCGTVHPGKRCTARRLGRTVRHKLKWGGLTDRKRL